MAQLKPYEKKEYVQSDSVNQAQQNLQNHQTTKPGDYVSKWEKPMGDLFGQIQNRGPFQFDINKDALYQQMVDRYVQQGQQAMMDTVGQVSAMTGGYGNSYAQTAGQQAYQGYLQALADQVPKFHGMALDRYQAEGDDMARRYAMMAQQEEQAYGRYNDSMDRYLAELARLQGIADREKEFDYNSFWQNQNFDYGAYQDALDQQYRADRDAAEDKHYQEQWQHQLEREEIKDQQWQAEFDEQKRRYDQEYALKQAAAQKSSGRGGGGSRGGRQPAAPQMSIEEVYWQAKEMGASTRELDAMLKQEIAKGNITSYDASELRNSHGPGTYKPSGGNGPYKNRTNSRR